MEKLIEKIEKANHEYHAETTAILAEINDCMRSNAEEIKILISG